MASIVLKFAKIKNYKVDSAFLDRMNDAFKKYGVRHKPPKRVGFKFSLREGDYVYTRFVKEIKRKMPILDQANEEVETTVIPAFGKKIFVFENGFIAYETSMQVYTGEIFDAITDAWNIVRADTEGKLDIERVDKIDPKTLKLFYAESKIVVALKIKEIGEKEPNPNVPSEVIKDIIEDAKEKTESVQIKGKIVGVKSQGNLKEVQIFDEGFVRLSELEEVKGVDREDFAFTISKSGRITSGLPEDPEKQKNKIIQLCKKVLKFLPV